MSLGRRLVAAVAVGAGLAATLFLLPTDANASTMRFHADLVADCATAAAWADSDVNTLTVDQAETSVFCLTNDQRAANGLAPLQWNDQLGAAARGHANDAVAQKWWVDGADFHTNPATGTGPGDRIQASGYCPTPVSWKWAENTNWGAGPGFNTPNAAVNWWMNSPGHRANILDPTLQDLGVGVAQGSPNPAYPDSGAGAFVQNFGTCT